MRALLFRCSPVGAAQVPDPGVATTIVSRIIGQHSPRVSLFFKTIHHFIDVLIFFFVFFCSIRRQSLSGACVDALVARIRPGRRGERTRDKRPEVRRAVFLYFFLVVIRSTVMLPMIFRVFGDF